MSWRLEPSPRTVGIEEGLAAKVHDPLWLLGRQWQLGEFNGKDAGTPALVQVAGTSAPVNAWRGAQQTDWTPFDGATVPLDALIEPQGCPVPALIERLYCGMLFLAGENLVGLGGEEVTDLFRNCAVGGIERCQWVRRRRRDGLARNAGARRRCGRHGVFRGRRGLGGFRRRRRRYRRSLAPRECGRTRLRCGFACGRRRRARVLGAGGDRRRND